MVRFNDESGASTAWSIFWLGVFLMIAGLVIDTSNAFRHKAALQATADASSLAAIIAYTEEEKFTTVFGTPATPPANASERGQMAANMLADINMDPDVNISTVMPTTEVTMGNWDGSNFISEANFTTGMVVNAAKARALRTSANSNPLNLLLVDIFTAPGTWDVGATSIAETYTPFNCPSKEGIMAGGTLNFASNNVFVGDLCIHGEVLVDFNANGQYLTNLEGESPTISYGVGGKICKGLGNCQTSEPYDNVIPYQSSDAPLTTDMIEGEATYLPLIMDIYNYYQSAINDTHLQTGLLEATNGTSLPAQNRYIPDALVTNPDRDPVTEPAILRDTLAELDALDPANVIDGVEDLTLPPGSDPSIVGGILRINISAADFEAAVAANASGVAVGEIPATPPTPPFPPHSVVHIDGASASSCSISNDRLTLTGDAPLDNVVVTTACRVIFNGTNSFATSAVFTSYNGTNAAIQGNEGAIIGRGTCEDDTLGSTIVSMGEVNFAAGVQVNGSRVISIGDVHISAQGDGMQGTQIMTAGDAFFTSNSEWRGCPNGLPGSEAEIDIYYKLVY